MKLNDFNFDIDDVIAGAFILYGKADIWKEDQNGIPHSFRNKYGEKASVKVPDVIDRKYKGRKLSSMIIMCNACELVTGVEAHYGRPGAGGYAVMYNGEFTKKDVTAFYRGA